MFFIMISEATRTVTAMSKAGKQNDNVTYRKDGMFVIMVDRLKDR